MENNQDSGTNLPVSLAKLDQDGLWLKMYQGYCQMTMGGGWEQFSETWPRAGMMRNGIVYQLITSAPRNPEIEYFLWPTLCSVRFNRIAYDGGSGARAKLDRMVGKEMRLEMCAHLNPRWAEWLMTFPDKWTDLEHSEMP